MTETISRVRLADPALGSREQRRVENVLESGALAAGAEVQAFEQDFADFCGADDAVATANGTAALHAALQAVGLGEGDRVITTPFSFVASANAIRFVGATPVFVDIDPKTFALDVEAVETAFESDPSIEAILAVHLYGLPAQVDQLVEIADTHDAVLIEDAAQAHGATLHGDHVGTFGDVGCFSFYPTKNMTTGEGGMLLTDRDEVAESARRFIDHGRTGEYEHRTVGHNFRMTEIAAAIGRVQLDRLSEANEARRSNAAALTDALSDLPLSMPVEPPGHHHVYHQFTVRTSARSGLQGHLDARGVDTGVYYPLPIHRQPPYSSRDIHLPEADRAAEEVLSLPIHPNLSTRARGRVISSVREWFE
jgi:dTDP-4-amino-4,6-dideoxygalactose transaminase